MQVTTVASLAAELDVSETTIRRLIKSGQLPAFKVGNSIRIRAEDLGAVLRRIPAGPGGSAAA